VGVPKVRTDSPAAIILIRIRNLSSPSKVLTKVSHLRPVGTFDSSPVIPLPGKGDQENIRVP
jgi:hypothetical protein